tara:strand:+ start:1140 stop:1286 length:147 start_codon:yes stop_codon:yes gene_type:complete
MGPYPASVVIFASPPTLRTSVYDNIFNATGPKPRLFALRARAALFLPN